jgi:hypothetical protein
MPKTNATMNDRVRATLAIRERVDRSPSPHHAFFVGPRECPGRVDVALLDARNASELVEIGRPFSPCCSGR